MREDNGEPQVSFRADTGELYSLDKKERILMKEVLRLSLATPSGRRRLLDRFGEEGFRIAISLLEQMGVKMEDPGAAQFDLRLLFPARSSLAIRSLSRPNIFLSSTAMPNVEGVWYFIWKSVSGTSTLSDVPSKQISSYVATNWQYAASYSPTLT